MSRVLRRAMRYAFGVAMRSCCFKLLLLVLLVGAPTACEGVSAGLPSLPGTELNPQPVLPGMSAGNGGTSVGAGAAPGVEPSFGGGGMSVANGGSGSDPVFSQGGEGAAQGGNGGTDNAGGSDMGGSDTGGMGGGDTGGSAPDAGCCLDGGL